MSVLRALGTSACARMSIKLRRATPRCLLVRPWARAGACRRLGLDQFADLRDALDRLMVAGRIDEFLPTGGRICSRKPDCNGGAPGLADLHGSTAVRP